MNKLFFLAIPLTLWLSLPTFAQTDDGEESRSLGYDQIVEQLSGTRIERPLPNRRTPFADTQIHGGVSLVTSHLNISPPKERRTSGFLRGVEARFGIDLLSRQWQAEGAIRSYSESDFEHSRAQLKEFDLRVVHRPSLTRGLSLRLGAGIAARYLDYQVNRLDPSTRLQFNTPASLFLVGLMARIHGDIHLGLDVAYRSALIEDTADTSSVDAGLGIHAQF